jgi:peptide-methionine (S)-S-oxide reductase
LFRAETGTILKAFNPSFGRTDMRQALLAALTVAALGAVAVNPSQAAQKTAVFAGGCFWSMEKAFDEVPGVTQTISGFSGGSVPNPTYREVVRGGTGHVEAVQVTYDDQRVSYDQLLSAYWHAIDPTDPSGQFCDKGPQYETVIFAGDAAEQASAQSSKQAVATELGKPVATRIEASAPFYAAEAEHQNFHVTNAAHYQRYLVGCGREGALARVWGARAAAKTTTPAG